MESFLGPFLGITSQDWKPVDKLMMKHGCIACNFTNIVEYHQVPLILFCILIRCFAS